MTTRALSGKNFVFLAILMVSLVGAAPVRLVSAVGGAPLVADLAGANEVPGAGDPDGSGFAKIRLNHGRGIVCYEITVSNIAPATAAHVHFAVAGVAGPVRIPLAPPTTGSSSGCVENVDKDLIKAIIQNPENYYVNVHNAIYPAGAVRGQLYFDED